MKKKKTITLKDTRLRKARTELRSLLILAKEERISEFYDQIEAIELDSSLDLGTKICRNNRVRQIISSLQVAFNHSTLRCRLCKGVDLDLTYNPGDDLWYCEECYTFNQSYYKRHPNEADWKKLYP